MEKIFHTDKDVMNYIQKVRQRIKDRKKEALFLERNGFEIMAKRLRKAGRG